MTDPRSSETSVLAASSAAPSSSPGRKLLTARRVNPYFLNWLSSHSLREARRRTVRARDMGARLASHDSIVQWIWASASLVGHSQHRSSLYAYAHRSDRTPPSTMGTRRAPTGSHGTPRVHRPYRNTLACVGHPARADACGRAG